MVPSNTKKIECYIKIITSRVVTNMTCVVPSWPVQKIHSSILTAKWPSKTRFPICEYQILQCGLLSQEYCIYNILLALGKKREVVNTRDFKKYVQSVTIVQEGEGEGEGLMVLYSFALTGLTTGTFLGT